VCAAIVNECLRGVSAHSCALCFVLCAPTAGIEIWQSPFAMATLNHLSALTAGHFLANAPKSNQKGLRSIIRPLRCASGSPRSGVLRARAAYGLLRKPTSRAFGYAEGCCAPGPTDAYARPPESLKIKSQIKIKIKSQIKSRIKSMSVGLVFRRYWGHHTGQVGLGPTAPTQLYSQAFHRIRTRTPAHGNPTDPEHHQGPHRAFPVHSGVSLTTITSMTA
jgi:hypothetical protein